MAFVPWNTQHRLNAGAVQACPILVPNAVLSHHNERNSVPVVCVPLPQVSGRPGGSIAETYPVFPVVKPVATMDNGGSRQSAWNKSRSASADFTP